MSIFRPCRRSHGVPIFKLRHGGLQRLVQVLSEKAKKTERLPRMTNDKEVLTEAEERCCRQSSLLSTFEEIAQTFLSSVSGERSNGKVFTSLQDYLDGSVLINGAYCRRRIVLLAIHDVKNEREARRIIAVCGTRPPFLVSLKSAGA